jgi:hypothetical protein
MACQRSGGAQEGLEVGERHFDGIEVRAAGSAGLPAASIACLVPWTLWASRFSMVTISVQLGNERLFDIVEKGLAVHGLSKGVGRGNAVVAGLAETATNVGGRRQPQGAAETK